MSSLRSPTHLLALLGVACLLGACWDDDPCDPGQIFEDLVCKPAPVEPPPDGGEGGMPSEPGPDASPWGTTCTSVDDCGGDAAYCDPAAPSPFNVCTQIDCSPGEANEGVCPADWTCLPAGVVTPTSICLPPM
jgi:hypothetical protein